LFLNKKNYRKKNLASIFYRKVSKTYRKTNANKRQKTDFGGVIESFRSPCQADSLWKKQLLENRTTRVFFKDRFEKKRVSWEKEYVFFLFERCFCDK